MRDGWTVEKPEYTLESVQELPHVKITSMPTVGYTEFCRDGTLLTHTANTVTLRFGPRQFIEQNENCNIFFYVDNDELYKLTYDAVYNSETFEPISRAVKTIRAVAIPFTDSTYSFDSVELSITKKSNRKLLLIGL